MFNFKNLEIEKLDVVGSICKINEMELSESFQFGKLK